MAAAIIGTLLHPEIVGYIWIVVAMVDRDGDRRAAVEGAADRGAAADRAVACVRRPGGGAGRYGEVRAVAARRRADAVPDRRRSPSK